MPVTLTEVGPRDGLQNDPTPLPPATRAELCRRLAATGLRRIEAVSFVRDDRVPAMAGAADVLQELQGDDATTEDTTYSALVLNERGLDHALAAGAREIHVAVMATDAFSQANTGMPTADALRQTRAIVSRAHAAGVAVVAGTVSVAFGCPFSGRVDPADALAVAADLVAAGVDELVLADTIGVATPRAVRRLVTPARTFGRPVSVHLHDTRNTATACALAALEAGATGLESSIGGLGGCPFAPGATGNVATEDLVYLLEEEGVDTGLDLDALIAVSHWLEGPLGHPVPSALAAV